MDFLRKIRKFFLTIWESSFNIAAYFFCGRRNMYRTVLVSDVNNERLNRLLEKVGMVLTPLSQDACMKRLTADGADFVVVVQDGDGRGAEFALRCAAVSDATVAFVARYALPQVLFDKLTSGGVCVLATLEERAFSAFFGQMVALRAAYNALRRENERLKRKVSEAQAVGRAKCLLVERRNMTEQSAHRFIEKTAMDNRLTRYAVAENIITGYERKSSSNGISA